jgi:hypothetical protein
LGGGSRGQGGRIFCQIWGLEDQLGLRLKENYLDSRVTGPFKNTSAGWLALDSANGFYYKTLTNITLFVSNNFMIISFQEH